MNYFIIFFSTVKSVSKMFKIFLKEVSYSLIFCGNIDATFSVFFDEWKKTKEQHLFEIEYYSYFWSI